MNDTFSFTLKSPLTEEQINLITDVELEHTDRIWFDTPKGKHVEFVKAQEWIPCSERLPEEDTDILVTYVDGEEARIIPVNYGRGTWFDCIFNSALDSLKVIAWMPLPEPYKTESEG